MRKPPFPYQQGDLDYLCHVYAAMNLLHIRGEIATLEGAGEKFTEALQWISTVEGGNLFAATTEGMDAHEVAEMLCVLGLPVDCIDAPAPEVVAERAAEGAVIFIEGDGWDHYTVIRAAGRTEIFQIFDSYGFCEFQSRGGEWVVDGETVELSYIIAPRR